MPSKIIHRLEALNAMRRKGRKLIIGVLGCMAERVKEGLLNEHGADLVAGPDAYLSLPDLIAQAEVGNKAIDIELSTTETYRDIVPERYCGSRISGFVSIMRGCNNFATIASCPTPEDASAHATCKAYSPRCATLKATATRR